MDKDTRNAIERATQRARKLLNDDFVEQLAGDFDVHQDGMVAGGPGEHLKSKPREISRRQKIVAAIEHKLAAGMSAAEAVVDYLRDAAFTTLNRFVALKMLEARELVQECITKGDQSAGYREFCGMAPAVVLLPESAGYRLYIESLFDELSTEVKVLFDRRDPASVLWPRRATFEALLEILNGADLVSVWGEDETIGWVYQYFNSKEERSAMRGTKQGGSQAPRNSRELAVRNQFFTPRYVVQFLTENTLGRIWYEMRRGQTALVNLCEHFIKRPDETYLPRAKEDPRDIRVLDPACGSGHFLLYAFALLLVIYEEAYYDADSPKSRATGRTLADDYASIGVLRRALPGLILGYNLYGVDIDPRCAQIASLALWMRVQRAFRDFDIGRAERPLIRRSSVVVAEPLVTDDATLKDFLGKLGDAELGHVFTDLVETLKLAGELGLLLRVEELIEPDSRRWQTGGLFAPPEARLREALERFVATSTSSASTRRRLFVDDAAQGLGLIEIARSRYDVLLMNPPFGDPPLGAAKRLDALYLAAKHDIASAFLERAMSLLAPRGMVGAIVTRTIFFLQYLREWREKFLFGQTRMSSFADTGIGVLDAMVETSLICFSRKTDSDPTPTHFIVANREDQRESQLRSAAVGGRGHRTLLQETLTKIPGSPLAFTISDEILRLFGSSKGIETTERGAFTGALTQDDFRFVRAWWEVPIEATARGWTSGTNKKWVPYVSGGSHTPIYADVRNVIGWGNDGEELKSFLTAYRGAKGFADQWTSQLNSYEHYFRPGVIWSLRPLNQGCFWLLPEGCVFGNNAPALLADDRGDAIWLVGILNSSIFRAILGLLMPRGNTGTSTLKYNLGYVRSVPVPEPSHGDKARLSHAVAEAWRGLRRLDARDETSHAFESVLSNSDEDSVTRIGEKSRIRSALSAIEDIAAEMYGVSNEAVLDLVGESGVSPCDRNLDINPITTFADRTADLFYKVQLAVGCVFGRWDSASLSATPTGHLETGVGTMPFSPVGLAQARPPTSRDVAVQDSGHVDDLLAAIHAVNHGLEEKYLFPGSDKDEVMSLLRKEFFQRHLAHYATSTRKAPIYWQLVTPSTSYSVWLYLHSFTKDTLYKVQNDYVAPKLAHEERRLESLRRDLGESPKIAERKAIAAQETFVEELRAFLEEVRRVAPLWNPNLDDGVVINFAPLWRLVPHHKSWQKELKDTWDALRMGDYDWTHLAMQLWPERVVPYCARDRSIAIAHGLESEFWVEGSDGKWKSRTTPLKSVDDLVRERTSAAVKAALKSLLVAPTASRTGRARVRGTASSAATEGGSR